ncbi:hypothetical protein [Eikenella sp. Marseille-P7795]|nr:hypothetical protein [Eikenella sp. Marseille-P7795]
MISFAETRGVRFQVAFITSLLPRWHSHAIYPLAPFSGSLKAAQQAT